MTKTYDKNQLKYSIELEGKGHISHPIPSTEAVLNISIHVLSSIGQRDGSALNDIALFCAHVRIIFIVTIQAD